MLPEFYQTHLQTQLKKADYLVLVILINLWQSIKQVNLEKLATALPLPILFESRRRKQKTIFNAATTDSRNDLATVN